MSASHESDSHDKRPVEQQVYNMEGSIDFSNKHPKPCETEHHENAQVDERVESSEQNKVDKQKNLKDNEHERMLVPEIEMTDRHNDQNNEVTEKRESLDEPLQAMLFNMFPSLATQKMVQPMTWH
ncbi:hypothetical protein RJT34_17389 [Clitoria ternatea]|uniref:Uncharacterized protein n=1 Tax=Clitoria ternatea TaxID=43366 RepID=A0AAN9PD42_CLITE